MLYAVDMKACPELLTPISTPLQPLHRPDSRTAKQLNFLGRASSQSAYSTSPEVDISPRTARLTKPPTVPKLAPSSTRSTSTLRNQRPGLAASHMPISPHEAPVPAGHGVPQLSLSAMQSCIALREITSGSIVSLKHDGGASLPQLHLRRVGAGSGQHGSVVDAGNTVAMEKSMSLYSDSDDSESETLEEENNTQHRPLVLPPGVILSGDLDEDVEVSSTSMISLSRCKCGMLMRPDLVWLLVSTCQARVDVQVCGDGDGNEGLDT